MKRKFINISEIERRHWEKSKHQPSAPELNGYEQWKLNAYGKLWNTFTDNMKRVFRSLIGKSKSKNRIAPATYRALVRRGVVMENRGTVYLNWRGCELLDYLRYSQQVTKDRKEAKA